MDIDTFYEKLGKNIKRIREEQHLTQDELAEKSGISLDYLGKIEVCIKSINIHKITLLDILACFYWILSSF
jgi:transcriptional regulator with XRE-family HTH domain